MLKFKKPTYISVSRKEPELPEGLWMKCDGCGQMLFKEDVVNNHYSCYKCGKYFRLTTKRRIRLVADKGTFEPWDEGIENSGSYANHCFHIPDLHRGRWAAARRS